MMRKLLALMAGGTPMSIAELSQALGARLPEVEAMLRQLTELGYLQDLACEGDDREGPWMQRMCCEERMPRGSPTASLDPDLEGSACVRDGVGSGFHLGTTIRTEHSTHQDCVDERRLRRPQTSRSVDCRCTIYRMAVVLLGRPGGHLRYRAGPSVPRPLSCARSELPRLRCKSRASWPN